ncbi:hypothetical protein DPMN_113391 [Dreissena polymorpha]|uniref:Uncharacterized protein n=1 Tax=Dreissena polymorpha TaxID=45954 RepID=A0A9D4KJ02_DREPO|nr:hypothetical protein DPMN_113391 [Dreissena polymorpha]
MTENIHVDTNESLIDISVEEKKWPSRNFLHRIKEKLFSKKEKTQYLDHGVATTDKQHADDGDFIDRDDIDDFVTKSTENTQKMKNHNNVNNHFKIK